MIESEELTKNQDKKKFDLMTKIVIIGMVVCLTVALTIIGSAVFLMIINSSNPDYGLPNSLENWASMSLGFLFATLFSLIKDFLVRDE